MAKLYEVDFRALANQLAMAVGAKTIDGLQWWLKGNLSPGGGLTFGASLENGSGLRLRCTGGTPSGVGSSGDLNEPHFFLPLTQVPSYSTTQALLIRGRFTRGAVSQAPLLGVADSTNDAVGLRAAVRAKDHFCGVAFTSTTTASVSYKAGASAVGLGAGRAGSIANSACVCGVLNNQLVGWGIHGNENLASGLPSDINSFLPASGNPSAGSTGDPHFQWTTRANPGIFFGVNSAGAFDSYLQWLRIDTLGEIQDSAAPTVTLISPPTTQLIGRKTPVVVRVQDESSLTRVYLWAEYDYGTEVIYAGDHFTTAFEPESDVTGTNPRDFTIVRTGGWLAPPTIHCEPIDGGGNTV